jgi:protein-disulfide isomerase
LVKTYKTDFVFLHFPVKEGESNVAMSANGLCAYRQDAEKFWQLNRLFFQIPHEKEEDQAYISGLAKQVGLDTAKIEACVKDPKTIETVRDQYNQIRQTKFYGTPTVFINGQALVGPKPYRVYRAALRKYIFF